MQINNSFKSKGYTFSLADFKMKLIVAILQYNTFIFYTNFNKTSYIRKE